MRITVHLDTFNGLETGSFAVLWCDPETGRWSREGHLGIDLPEWGVLRGDGCDTVVEDPQRTCTLFALEGLDLSLIDAPHRGEDGIALYRPGMSAYGSAGHWSVQCVDAAAVHAEHSVFADADLHRHSDTERSSH
ncbi:DUF3564 family protein [Pararobbsia silviterrae]|uniref:DUF3564 family protein n=1 Tax=Pararobbsia silviterrae TaxID=1792498 RepID=A0A494Y3C2_9BURK|nr:DUF3564 family protein [Pararobbsia silviterrae]RKP55953.1 DUF3564 family protein [Pararobbsia silviterrae]